MLNIKDTVNFTTLREKGPSSIDLKNDEIIQVVSKGTEIKIVLTQEYFMKMYNCYISSMNKFNATEEPEVNVQEKSSSLESRFMKIADLANQKED